MLSLIIGFILAFTYLMSNIKFKTKDNFYYKREFEVFFNKC